MTEIWPKIFIIGYGENARASTLMPALNIRQSVLQKRQSIGCQTVASVEVGADGNLKKQLEKANKFKADYAVILKDEEKSAIKDMKTGEQRDIPSAWLGDEFERLMEERFYG